MRNSPSDAWILGYFPDTWSSSIQDTHTCNKLYPVYGYCLRILASFRRRRRAFLFWVIHIGNLAWVDAGFWVDHYEIYV